MFYKIESFVLGKMLSNELKARYILGFFTSLYFVGIGAIYALSMLTEHKILFFIFLFSGAFIVNFAQESMSRILNEFNTKSKNALPEIKVYSSILYSLITMTTLLILIVFTLRRVV